MPNENQSTTKLFNLNDCLVTYYKVKQIYKTLRGFEKSKTLCLTLSKSTAEAVKRYAEGEICGADDYKIELTSSTVTFETFMDIYSSNVNSSIKYGTSPFANLFG